MHHHCRQVGLHHDEDDRRDDARYAAVTEYLNEARTPIGAGLLLHGSTGPASLFRLGVVPLTGDQFGRLALLCFPGDAPSVGSAFTALIS